MAGHSKFKNIQHRKNAQDLRRAKIFTRVVRDIQNAAKSGGGDPSKNPRLQTVLVHAKAINLPKDRIERAINSALNAKEQDEYIEMRYEGFIDGIALIIEVLTDNRNRSAAQIRSIFNKYDASLGTVGSVSFLFMRKGVILYDTSVCDADSFLEAAITAGALDVASGEDNHLCYTQDQNFCDVLENLQKVLGDCAEASIQWSPLECITSATEGVMEKVEKLVEALEALEDVQKVSTNLLTI
jgi:YebC/PmpR family DNA-binding regulatory protein